MPKIPRCRNGQVYRFARDVLASPFRRGRPQEYHPKGMLAAAKRCISSRRKRHPISLWHYISTLEIARVK
jgi:hypothetical protein